MATTVSCVPSMEISWPMKSNLKSLLSRSGVVSTRIFPGMGAAYGLRYQLPGAGVTERSPSRHRTTALPFCRPGAAPRMGAVSTVGEERTLDAVGLLSRQLGEVAANVGSVLFGKRDVVRLTLACLAAGGHLLIEDLPGVGKTTLAKALAQTLGLHCRRVQFTADLLPSDLIGAMVLDRERMTPVFHPGPVFTNILLADELNRASPKAQSALLEAMEEGQVSVDGVTHPLPKPFMVIATQNPYDASGTYPLPVQPA